MKYDPLSTTTAQISIYRFPTAAEKWCVNDAAKAMIEDY